MRYHQLKNDKNEIVLLIDFEEIAAYIGPGIERPGTIQLKNGTFIDIENPAANNYITKALMEYWTLKQPS